MASASASGRGEDDEDQVPTEGDIDGAPRAGRRRRRHRGSSAASASSHSSRMSASDRDRRSPPEVRYRGGKPPDPPVYSGEANKDNPQDPFGWKLFLQKVRVYERRAAPYLPPSEQALALYQALEGRAAEQLSDVDLDEIDKPDGVNILLALLEKGGFKLDDLVQSGRVLQSWETIKRRPGESLYYYVPRFERAASMLEKYGRAQLFNYYSRENALKYHGFSLEIPENFLKLL